MSVVEQLRTLQRPGSGGSFFGTGQTQLFTPRFAASTYAIATVSPSLGTYISLLYRLRFPPDLHPNAFSMVMSFQGDPLLSAQLDGGYIEEGFGADGSLLVPLSTARPLNIRVENLDTVTKMWSADFDTLTISSPEDWTVALEILSEGSPSAAEIAALLSRGDPYVGGSSGMRMLGSPGAGRPQRDLGPGRASPLRTSGRTQGGVQGQSVFPPDLSESRTRQGGPP